MECCLYKLLGKGTHSWPSLTHVGSSPKYFSRMITRFQFLEWCKGCSSSHVSKVGEGRSQSEVPEVGYYPMRMWTAQELHRMQLVQLYPSLLGWSEESHEVSCTGGQVGRCGAGGLLTKGRWARRQTMTLSSAFHLPSSKQPADPLFKKLQSSPKRIFANQHKLLMIRTPKINCFHSLLILDFKSGFAFLFYRCTVKLVQIQLIQFHLFIGQLLKFHPGHSGHRWSLHWGN